MINPEQRNITAAMVFTLCLLLTCLFFLYFPRYISPDEDALILFRYAENLADHGVISYNTDGLRSEGATDFLWMVILSALYRFGIPVYVSALLLTFVSLPLTAGLICAIAREKSPLLFGCVLLYLLLIPNLYASLCGFSHTFFGCWIILTLYCLIRQRIFLYAFAAAVTVLVRPDGIIFVAPGLLWLVVAAGPQRKAAVYSAGIFTAIIGGYFLWRYNYFGLLMPLPFYIKKSHRLFVTSSLLKNAEYFLYAIPFVASLVVGIRKKHFKLSKNTFILALTYVCAFGAYSRFVLYQNVYERFQYPFLLLATVLFFANAPRKKLAAYLIPLGLIVIMLMPKQYSFLKGFYWSRYINMFPISRQMQNCPSDLKLLTTEAGIMPYYTGWQTTDAWGLNSPDFTRKVITPEDIRRIDPDIVVINNYWDYSFLERREYMQSHHKKSWYSMNQNIFLGIDSRYETFMTPIVSVNTIINDPLFDMMQPERWNILYYCFFIKKNLDCFELFKNILEKSGAITYPEYKRKIVPKLRLLATDS